MMKKIQGLILICVLPLLAFTTVHKYYVSVTQIDYIEERGELQLTSRIFVDDLEKLLRERYDESVTLAGDNESDKVHIYLDKYLRQKIGVKINGEAKTLKFLGKEYEDDIAICYLEISDIQSIKSIEITNTVLFDIFEEQKNIIRMKINSKRKSFILIPENDKGLLNFD
jgi:hypothetical protein